MQQQSNHEVVTSTEVTILKQLACTYFTILSDQNESNHDIKVISSHYFFDLLDWLRSNSIREVDKITLEEMDATLFGKSSLSKLTISEIEVLLESEV